MIKIEVIGVPRPGGGKIAGIGKKTGKLFVRPDNPNTKYWRADVQQAANQQYNGELMTAGIVMKYMFRFPRPKSHYRSGKNSHILKENAPRYHISKPDLTKIIRSTEDALTGIVWRDDSQVYDRGETKRYCDEGEKPGVSMTIWHDLVGD